MAFIKNLLVVFCGCAVLNHTSAQIIADTVKFGQFDMGKMWTFDAPPTRFFSETYQFDANAQWFNNARLAAVRFASWCSASFVSGNGLIMTNHHCSRDVALTVQKAGENFNENGFYAKTLRDERKIEDLYVDQLVQILDITNRLQQAEDKGSTEEEKSNYRRTEQEAILNEYKNKSGWEGLELQVIRFYSGGRYALYGFRRYTDVRLVFIPELQLGYYGGDYDNFTYPRYAFDCTFFRVYDDKGKPLQTPHYFRFNVNGAQDGEAVFVIGNPGTTNRLQTVSDLEFRRDVQLPLTLSLLSSRSRMLKEHLATQYSDSIQNVIFGLENSIKATTGIHNGMKDPYLVARKAAFERYFKSQVGQNPATQAYLSEWDEIDKRNQELRSTFPVVLSLANLSVSDFGGTPMSYAFQLVRAATNSPFAAQAKRSLAAPYQYGNHTLEQKNLANQLRIALESLGADHPFVTKALNGQTPENAAAALLRQTRLNDTEYRKKVAALSGDELSKETDPIIQLALMAVPVADAEIVKFRSLTAAQQAARAKLGRALYDIFGEQIPPDATFSLRIADGVVAGYNYNGTIAPPVTTFFGLYDRYYSFKHTKHKDWNLPARWLSTNPPFELLRTPMNFVTTCDIIGGNSGSPIVNKKLEVVGLIFDGNIESLPGEFIYLPEVNRSICVHTGGIAAAVKYIYKADRLHAELLKGKL